MGVNAEVLRRGLQLGGGVAGGCRQGGAGGDRVAADAGGGAAHDGGIAVAVGDAAGRAVHGSRQPAYVGAGAGAGGRAGGVAGDDRAGVKVARQPADAGAGGGAGVHRNRGVAGADHAGVFAHQPAGPGAVARYRRGAALGIAGDYIAVEVAGQQGAGLLPAARPDGHIGRGQPHIADDPAGAQRIEQPGVSAPGRDVDRQVGDGMPPAVKRRGIQGADGGPVGERIRGGHAVHPVGIEIQVAGQFVAEAPVRAAQPRRGGAGGGSGKIPAGERPGVGYVIAGSVGQPVAVQVVADGV